jgi:nucleoside-diphosphate-sugar epimerase
MTKHIILYDARNFLGLHLAQRFSELGFRITIFSDDANSALGKFGRLFPLSDISESELNRASIFVYVADSAVVDEFTHRTNGIAKMAVNAISKSMIKRVIVHSSVAADIAETNSSEARQYGMKKLTTDREFQRGLRSNQKCIFVRAPAIYGKGMPGPMSVLYKVASKLPFVPLGAATVARPYISAENLVSVFEVLVNAPDSKMAQLRSTVIRCKDEENISTKDLVAELAKVSGGRARLVYVPRFILRGVGKMAGKSDLISGALDPVPCETTTELTDLLGWKPVNGMPESLSYLKKLVSL